MPIRTFLSYSSDDQKPCSELQQDIRANASEGRIIFENYQINPVLAATLRDGLDESLFQKIDSSNAFVAVLSKQYLDPSRKTSLELDRAINAQRKAMSLAVAFVVTDEFSRKWLFGRSSDRVNLLGDKDVPALVLFKDGQYQRASEQQAGTDLVRKFIENIENTLVDLEQQRIRIAQAAQVVLLGRPRAAVGRAVDIEPNARALKVQLESFKISVDTWQDGWAAVTAITDGWPTKAMADQLLKPSIFVRLISNEEVADVAAMPEYRKEDYNKLETLGNRILGGWSLPDTLKTAAWVADTTLSEKFNAAPRDSRVEETSLAAPVFLRLVGNPADAAKVLRRELGAVGPQPLIFVQPGAHDQQTPLLEAMIEKVAPEPPDPIDWVDAEFQSFTELLKARGRKDAILVAHDMQVQLLRSERGLPDAERQKMRATSFSDWQKRIIGPIERKFTGDRQNVRRREPFRLLVLNRFCDLFPHTNRLGGTVPWSRWNILHTTGDDFRPDETSIEKVKDALGQWFQSTAGDPAE